MQLWINNVVLDLLEISHLISSFFKSKYPISKALQRKHDILKMLCLSGTPCSFFFFN